MAFPIIKKIWTSSFVVYAAGNDNFFLLLLVRIQFLFTRANLEFLIFAG